MNNLAAAPSNRDQLGGLGAIPAMILSMETNLEFPSVLERMSAALLNMVVDHKANKEKVIGAGGMAAGLAAMRTHGDHAGVQEQACRFLREAFTQNDANKKAFVDLGGCQTIATGMRTSLAFEDLQFVACQALSSLSGPTALKASVAESGAVEAIIEAMKAFPANPKVQEQVITCFNPDFLHNLS